jgi:Zn-dependent protease
MKWSWKVGKFAGIGVFVHFTFPLLLAWVAIVYWRQYGTVAAVADGILFILAVFLCVVLHEFGHALTARRYHVQTKDITLLPIGGVARLERIPEKPSEEFMVAIMGPAVNVAIAGLIWLGYKLTVGLPQTEELEAMTRAPFLLRLMAVNVFIVLFNAIPATRMDRLRATEISAALGRMLALMFGFFGLLYNPLLILIAFFVWSGATGEATMAQMKSVFGGVPVRDVMLTEFRTITTHDTLAHVAEMVLAGSQKDFPVVEDGRVAGMLSQKRMLAGLTQTGPQTLVGSVMQGDPPSVRADEMFNDVFPRIQGGGGESLPVLAEGRLVGLLTMDNVSEFLMIHAATQRER